MSDIIKLLPDSIANQIAAGEVIQRPASLLKELMENSIDAGCSSVKVVIKDAGKSLVQVIDDGCGMTETDARMAFERHATSKIKKADDLFAIRTMGFRGEALASIAAVAQVELRTRRHEDEIGTRIVIEDSKVKLQEPIQCSPGTIISVKNLFYNVPARRNFLKSNSREMRHLVDEFQRVALSNPDVFFSLHHNGDEIFHLPPGKLRQRIVGIFGNNYNKRLVPIGEETEVIKLFGYIGKPEFAKKTRGEQLFFVNNRFIKSPYLNHAVINAYEGVLQKETHPLYVIFIELDPSRIDINVHPTKQEIKFDDERLVYNYLKVTVRHALGQYSITPSLDFEQEVGITRDLEKEAMLKEEMSKSGSFTMPSKLNLDERQLSNNKNWEKLYEGLEAFNQTDAQEETKSSVIINSEWTNETSLKSEGEALASSRKKPYQLHNKYIVSQIKSGFILIDQQAAHQRIKFERYMAAFENGQSASQKQLFPKTINLPSGDADIFKKMLPEINLLGFDVQEFGKDAFVVHGLPAELEAGSEEKIIDSLLNQFKRNVDLKIELRESVALSLAKETSIKAGQVLTEDEMQELFDQLFACSVPFKSPAGRLCFVTYDLEDISNKFKNPQ